MRQMFFMDAASSLDALVARAQEEPFDLTLDDVRIVEAAASSGEIFSPQLLPYKEWIATNPVNEEDERGLFEAGSLHMVDEDTFHKMLSTASDSEFSLDGIPVDANGHPIDLSERQVVESPDEVPQEGILGVREDPDGYAIVEVDLHEYKNRLGHKVSDLVIVLPRSIDGVPVVRIASSAFRPRLVNGVGVRLVVIPDSVAHIRRDALSPLAVENVFISRSVQVIEPQEFSAKTATVRAEHIAFHVDPRNPAFASRDGSLYSRDGKELLFQAYPYGQELVLPEGLERIMTGAFVTKTPGPEVVRCPSTLSRVDSKPTPDRLWDPETLWVCPVDSPQWRMLNTVRPITISPNFVRDDEGFYYDIDEAGEACLVRSPRAYGRLVLPTEVAGHPLTSVREAALPKRLTGLVVPPCVRSIGKNNLCTGLEELVLPDGIEEIGEASFRSRKLPGITRLPASLKGIGRGCFEGALCRFEACGATVQVSVNQQVSCFRSAAEVAEMQAAAASGADPHAADGLVPGVPFDFAAYDEYLTSGHHVPDRLGAILLRLQTPCQMSEAKRDELVAWLRRDEGKVLERIGRIGDPQLLDQLCAAGFITEQTIDEQAEILRRLHKTDAVLFLMDYRQKHFGAAQQESVHSRFAL